MTRRRHFTFPLLFFKWVGNFRTRAIWRLSQAISLISHGGRSLSLQQGHSKEMVGGLLDRRQYLADHLRCQIGPTLRRRQSQQLFIPHYIHLYHSWTLDSSPGTLEISSFAFWQRMCISVAGQNTYPQRQRYFILTSSCSSLANRGFS